MNRFTELMEYVARGFEALGAAILVVGVIWSFVLAAVAVRRSGWSAKAYLVLRQAFGGTLLLGLEVLIEEEIRVADDPIQRGSDLMAHGG